MNEKPTASRQTRREFFGDAARGTAVMTFGTVAPSILCQAAAASPQDERVLVVVEMAGGNDGLNTVVPHSDAGYQQARQQIGIAKSDTLAVTDEIGLHRSLRGLADLLEQGRFAVVQGVGYENPNRSHFESMDIWHSCLRKSDPRHDGWIGRFLETANLEQLRDPSALHLGSENQPFALMSRNIRVPSIQSLDQFRLQSGDSPGFRQAVRELADQSREGGNDLLGFVQSSTSSALAASERMESAGVKYKPSESYPTSGLGKKLETVAKLIASGLQTKVYYVRIDGFDTHANQPDAHAALLREVSESVSTLIRDANAHSVGDRVLVMCFSEFGRRVAENASDGTDHGTAGPIFLAGNKVKAGLIGAHPSLADLDNGDLKHHTDFRQVYAAVLEDWLSCPSETVLGGNYQPAQLFDI
jgi:uncharacterized protein (DUF1501 family)